MNLHLSFYDISRGSTTSIFIPLIKFYPFLHRVCEGDCRNGWKLLSAIFQVMEETNLHIGHPELHLTKTTPIAFAVEFMASLFIHESEESCSCGIHHSFTNSQWIDILPLWIELTKGITCLIMPQNEVKKV